MRPVKGRGLNHELRPLIKRVERSVEMERISLKDGQRLLDLLTEAKTLIEEMTETNIEEE
jgi:hypothetical protein